MYLPEADAYIVDIRQIEQFGFYLVTGIQFVTLLQLLWVCL